jgi:trimeric autotransporter adhesin
MSMRIIVLFFASLLIFLPVLGCGSNYNGGTMMSAAPAITELVPNDTPAGSPGFTLTINGSGFGTGAAVYWNGAALTTSYVTGNQVTAAVPMANVTTTGSVPVYVRSGTKNSNTLTFTVQ